MLVKLQVRTKPAALPQHSSFQIQLIIISALLLFASCQRQTTHKESSERPSSDKTATASREPVAKSDSKSCDPNSLALVNDLVEKGKQAHGTGAYRDEFELVSKAIEICPNHFWAYFMRGQARFKLGYRKETCDDFKTALKLAGNDSSYAEAKKFIYHMQDQCKRIGFWESPLQASEEPCFKTPTPTCLFAVAEAMALTIQIPGWQNQTQAVIASAKNGQLPGPKRDMVPPTQIPDALRRARAITDDMHRAFILRNLAWSQAAAGDTAGAIATVNLITGKRSWGEDPSVPWRAETLAGIAAIMANPGVPLAKMWNDARP